MGTQTAASPGIRPGQLVRIALPGRDRATASVTYVAATWLTLRLSAPDSRSVEDFHGVRVQVEYVADDGMHRLMGDLEPSPGSPACTLRFVMRSGPQFLGRREHLRTALTAPVVLTVDRTGQKFRGRSVNVSEGGMLVEDLDGGLPAPGSRVRFALAPRSSSHAIVGTAIVTRADSVRGRLAFSFEQLPRSTADEIARVVFEHEHGSRARRR
jgi:hypothetical protein